MDIYHKINRLMEINDYQWGYYELSKDMLSNKISDNEKNELAEMSVKNIREIVSDIKDSNGPLDIYEIIKKADLKIESSYIDLIPQQIVFAIYEEPNKIIVSKHIIEKYKDFLQKELTNLQIELSIDIESMILAHEYFHYYENLNEDSIYTKTHRIPLWSLGPYTKRSRIRGLSEFSAKLFSKEFNEIEISPYVIEFIVIHLYNTELADEMYEDILTTIG